MGWIQAGMFRDDSGEEEEKRQFLRNQKASCRNANVKVGEDFFEGLDVFKGVRHVKVHGDSWERKSGTVVMSGQEFPVWQDEGWNHWELDPDEIHTKELVSKGDFHYKI
jgi:hypothetical protein